MPAANILKSVLNSSCPYIYAISLDINTFTGPSQSAAGQICCHFPQRCQVQRSQGSSRGKSTFMIQLSDNLFHIFNSTCTKVL